MARLQPDILSGLLAIEPIAPKSSTSAADPGQEGLFEQYLDQARREAAESDSRDQPAEHVTLPATESGATDPSDADSCIEDHDQAAAPKDAAARQTPAADRAPSDRAATAADDSEPSDNPSTGSAENPPEASEAAEKPREKGQKEKRDTQKKAQSSPAAVAPAALTAAAAIAEPATIANQPVGAEALSPEAAVSASEMAAPKTGKPPGEVFKAAGSTAKTSGIAILETAHASQGNQAEPAASEVQPLAAKGPPGKAVAFAELDSAEATAQKGQAVARETLPQDPALPPAQKEANPRRRETKQAAKDIAVSRPIEAATDGATPEKTVPLDQPAPSVERKPSVDEMVAAAVELVSESRDCVAQANSTSESPAQADGSPRAAANQPQRPGPSAETHPAPGAAQADRVRFVERVARAFHAIGDRGGSIRLRLHPPELGALRVEVTVRHGTMTARLETETAAARAMLLENLPALRERLAEHQIKVDRFDVDLADHSAGGASERYGHGSERPDYGNRPSWSREQLRGNEPEKVVERRAVARPGEGSRLDVFI